MSELAGRPQDVHGRELDAEFLVETVGEGSFAVTIKSGNGVGTNPEYNAGFDHVLARLRQLGAVLTDAILDSRTVQHLPEAERAIHLRDRGYPLPLETVDDPTALRVELCTAAKSIGQLPDASGGNYTKRIRLLVSAPHSDVSVLRDFLVGLDTSPRSSWADRIAKVLQERGAATLGQIYTSIRDSAHGEPLPKELEATIRATIERHSSDSDKFAGKRDLFASVDGKGSGSWALRSKDQTPARCSTPSQTAKRKGPMPTKRDVVENFRRDELQSIVEAYELEVPDRRVREHLIDAVVRAKRVRLPEILAPFSRDRLKELCNDVGLDDGGREKSVIIDRLCGETEGVETNEPIEREVDASGVLLKALKDSLLLYSGANTWPAQGLLRVAGQQYEVSIYARVIGGSARGNPLERRFQNPSQGSPIIDDPDRYELLWGLWTEQGEERTVIVAFDVFRRMDKQTRFSMFMPLSLLEQAADTGFATHDNARGETIYAFRPENLARYIQAEMDAGNWRTRRAEMEPARPQREVRVAKPVPVAQVKTDSIYIRPRVGMYSAFARLNYKPWFALAEFLDNSIQSFLRHRSALAAAGHDGPLVIDVNIDDNEISITDRAGGIAAKDFPRAFSPAAPPEDASGLSEFGLGMKAAACWFSKKWTVRTSALGESVERTVTFDIPKISREGVEDLPIESRPARESDHFTVITMQDLRVRPRGRTLQKIRDHLSSIYRVLMKDGIVRIRVTTSGKTEELAYEQPELLNAPYYEAPGGPSILWRTEFNVAFDDKKVTGWAGLLATGSHSHAGFSVFRRRRLIEGSVGETYKPQSIFGAPNSFASGRVVGEMFVEGFDVTHTKDGVQWHGYEDEVLAAIREQLDTRQMPLLDQANGYRARKRAETLPATFGAEALASTANGLVQASASGSMPKAETIEVPAPPSLVEQPAAPEAVLQQRDVTIQIIRDAKPWTIHMELVRDRAMPFYSTATEERDGTEVVMVRVNLDHEFSVAYINDNESALQPLIRLIAALALAEKLGRSSGLKGLATMRGYANEVLGAMAAAGMAKR